MLEYGMKLWVIFVTLSIACICLMSLFTIVAPKVSTKVRLTDPPDTTRPPALNIDAYPLQSWKRENEPSSDPTR